MRWVLVLFLAGGLAAATPARAEVSACARTEASLGAGIRVARAALMQIRIGEMDPDVSSEAQASIERVKDRIVAFVTGTMRCISPNARAAGIRNVLASRGDAFDINRLYAHGNAPPDRHGNGLTYEVQRPATQPSLLAVEASLAIECGDDMVLILFERGRNGWRPIMIRRSPPYREIGDAFGGLSFALSRSDRQGRWYLATNWTTPQCQSAWYGLRYDLSRPGPSPDQPHILMQRHVSAYLDENGESFRVEPHFFQVRHLGGIAHYGILVRRHVETYAIDDERVRRIQPAAFNVRDFADEWIASDWTEAADWSAHDSNLRDVHRLLQAPSPARLRELGAIRACADGDRQVQLGEDGDAWYLFVRGNGLFRMVRAARSPSPSCRGPDLRPEIDARARPW